MKADVYAKDNSGRRHTFKAWVEKTRGKEFLKLEEVVDESGNTVWSTQIRDHESHDRDRKEDCSYDLFPRDRSRIDTFICVSLCYVCAVFIYAGYPVSYGDITFVKCYDVTNAYVLILCIYKDERTGMYGWFHRSGHNHVRLNPKDLCSDKGYDYQ